MTIQRQYSLPNCTLVLEGVGEEPTDPSIRPLLTMLINAECRIVGYSEPIAGGQEFFENLVKAVSQYAQEVLSGVSSPHYSKQPSLVELRRGNQHLHQLIVRNSNATNGNGGMADRSTELKLTTVQLFDLVEAVDQALADTQTLPQLSLNLAPVSRRRAGSGEAIAKRAVPAALGASSLALAAVALFFLPVPEVRRIEEPVPQSTTDPSSGTPSDTPTAAAGDPPSQAEAASANSESADSENSEASESLDEALETAPLITDADQILELNDELRVEIAEAWTEDPTFDEDLIYRIAVSSEGDIVGYKYVNDAALTYVDETPLPDLRDVPAAGGAETDDPIAQYKVVLTPRGVVEVSPWYALPESSEQDSDEESGPKAVRDPRRLEILNDSLYDLIQEEREPQAFPGDLVYRVTFNEAGQVVDYEPTNQVAIDYEERTPLPNLKRDDANQARSSTMGQNDFKVVFTERGVLEVSPWDGWP